MGARRAIAQISRRSCGELMQGGQIGIASSPSHGMLSNGLNYVRRGAAEALEIVAHGDHKSSGAGGRKIADTELRRGTTIGATVRGTGDAAEIVIAHLDTEINPEEHLIVFVETRRKIPRLDTRLQVGMGFF